MPMERSVSCAERGSMYGVGGAGVDVRSYSASYARPQPQKPPVQRARSVSAWARPAPPPAVQRTGSTKSSVGGTARPTPGINLRSYSASFAASYGPTLQLDGGAGGGGGQGQLKRSGSVTNWTSANRRSVNLRGYTPSFAALDDTAAAVVPVPARKVVQGDAEAELQRRKRLVVYKTYDVEGKVRQSVRRSVSWIKGKCSGILF